MGKILIDFEAHEALLALGAIQDKQLTSSRLAAISEGEEHEIADLSAKVLHRVATRLVDALYGDQLPDMRRQDLEAEIEFGLT